MTTSPALASQRQLTESSTSLPAKLSEAAAKLEPISAKAGTAELMACLTLVAPSGMTQDDRHAWVAVAKQTLSGIPADLLQRGCAKARLTCRFASEIVPTIAAEVQDQWNWRKRRLAEEQLAYENRNAPRIERRKPEAIPREETQRILREVMTSMGSGQ